uniref:Multicopper oxidase putative n=1 Tax=Albugo laibachii Nc14 TaxID=890382 RepID=F0WGC0_9STRA|nr:multicopper oxidase putative [Albugo laibachii Nc14]|eukprot:CCA20280.1 multicopper oxidase putative [Albugo laibachii Nc14]
MESFSEAHRKWMGFPPSHNVPLSPIVLPSTISHPTFPGTYWWHSHEKAQYVDGLRGPLIIHDILQNVDGEYVLQLTDWYHTESRLLVANATNVTINPRGDKPVWNTVLINDRGRFNCTQLDTTLFPVCNTTQPLSAIQFLPGKLYRLRLINQAGFASFNFSIDGHVFQVIETDGFPVQPSKLINALVVNIGQRYDILVRANGSASDRFWIRSTSLFDSPFTSLPLDQFPSGFNPNGLAILEYCAEKRDSSMIEPKSTEWNFTITVANDLDFIPTDSIMLPRFPEERMTVEFTLAALQGDPVTRGYASINQSPYETFLVPPTPTLFDVANGNLTFPSTLNPFVFVPQRHTEVVILNNSPAEHPFHLHGHTPHVLGSGLIDINASNRSEPIPSSALNLLNPVRRDVFTLPSCTFNVTLGGCQDRGYVVLRLETDNPGTWILHCHIEWHLETGMAMLFIEDGPALMRRGTRGFGPSILETCA